MPISWVRSITAMFIVLPTVNSTIVAIKMAMKPKIAPNIPVTCPYCGFSVAKPSTSSGSPASRVRSSVWMRARAAGRSAVCFSCTTMDVTFALGPLP